MMKIYNTLTKCKEAFEPLKSNEVGMYVCGPTVYGPIHIGNARSAIIYDVLFRFLKYKYENVTYVRNITDVDDKIVNVANSKGVNANEIAEYYTKLFHDDLCELNCLLPTFEPKVTDNIDLIINIIKRLLGSGHAYVKDGSVYFDISSYGMYGNLSNRTVQDLNLGHRVDVDDKKDSFEDFILWKPAASEDRKGMSYWPSPWGDGRPGWHIECSAMSYFHLGHSFDIHGGGIDLQFPHHENEIAQSRCSFPEGIYAKYWCHNGSLMMNKDKMSKSLGNLITVRELIDQGFKGEVIRYALLTAHYRKPLLWSSKILQESKSALDRFYTALKNVKYNACEFVGDCSDDNNLLVEVCECFEDDMNFPKAISVLHNVISSINKAENLDVKKMLCKKLIFNANFLGILRYTFEEWFSLSDNAYIEELIDERKEAKKKKDFLTADRIRQKLFDDNIVLSDNSDGSVTWHKR